MIKRSKKVISLSFLFVAFIFLFVSCISSPSSKKKPDRKASLEDLFNSLEPIQQSLSEDEEAAIALWKESTEKLIVQVHQSPSGDNEGLVFNPFVAAYEGYRIVSMLELNEILNGEELLAFVLALFDSMPKEVSTGALVKSIVIPSWFNNGMPLVINITRAYGEDKVPVLVYMFNTRGVRRLGPLIAKKMGPGYMYPRMQVSEGQKQEFMDYFGISMLDNGFLTASLAYQKKLPEFSALDSDFEKLNLVDDYLRDGNPDNDGEVLLALTDIIQRDELDYVSAVFSRIQLFMYYLFDASVVEAENVIDELEKTGLLDIPEVAKTIVGQLAKNDLRRILYIAKALADLWSF